MALIDKLNPYLRRLLSVEIRSCPRPRARRPYDRQGRFDVGCGPEPKSGHVGCDIRALKAVSIVCRAWELNRFTNEAEAIYSRHTIEHLTLKELELTLESWHRALRLGGKVEIIVPDIDFHIEQWRAAQWSHSEMRDKWSPARHSLAGFWGWQRECDPSGLNYNQAYWDVHKMGFCQSSLHHFLIQAGFTDVETSTNDSHLVGTAAKTVLKDERQVSPTIRGIRSDHRERYLFASRYLSANNRVLDVACGVGYGAYLLASNESLIKVHAIDIDPYSIRYANTHYSHRQIEYFQNSVEDCDLPQCHYDLVVALEIIEHLKNPLDLFHLCHRVLKSGGHMIVSTPNSLFEPYSPRRFPYHICHYSLDELRTLASSAGLQVTEVHSQKTREPGKVEEGSTGIFLILTLTKE